MLTISKQNAVFERIHLKPEMYDLFGRLRAVEGIKFRHVSPRGVSNVIDYEVNYVNKILAFFSNNELLELFRAGPFHVSISQGVRMITSNGSDEMQVNLSGSVFISDLPALIRAIGYDTIHISDVEEVMKVKYHTILTKLISDYKNESSAYICQKIERSDEVQRIFSSIGLTADDIGIHAFSKNEAEEAEYAKRRDRLEKEDIYKLQHKVREHMLIDPLRFLESVSSISEKNPMVETTSLATAIQMINENNNRLLAHLSDHCDQQLLAEPNGSNVIEFEMPQHNDYERTIAR